jgi:hypothetical protein
MIFALNALYFRIQLPLRDLTIFFLAILETLMHCCLMKHMRRKQHLVITSGTRQLTLSLWELHSAELTARLQCAANESLAPRSRVNASPAILKQRDAEVIDRLLDVCSHYAAAGDTQSSVLVDRIGMTLMQIFMDRAEKKT